MSIIEGNMNFIYKLLNYKFFGYIAIFLACGFHFTVCLILKIIGKQKWYEYWEEPIPFLMPPFKKD
jgi:hypothetical protein